MLAKERSLKRLIHKRDNSGSTEKSRASNSAGGGMAPGRDTTIPFARCTHETTYVCVFTGLPEYSSAFTGPMPGLRQNGDNSGERAGSRGLNGSPVAESDLREGAPDGRGGGRRRGRGKKSTTARTGYLQHGGGT